MQLADTRQAVIGFTVYAADNLDSLGARSLSLLPSRLYVTLRREGGWYHKFYPSVPLSNGLFERGEERKRQLTWLSTCYFRIADCTQAHTEHVLLQLKRETPFGCSVPVASTLVCIAPWSDLMHYQRKQEGFWDPQDESRKIVHDVALTDFKNPRKIVGSIRIGFWVESKA